MDMTGGLRIAIAEDQALILEKWAKEWEKDQYQRAHDARIIAENLVNLARALSATPSPSDSQSELSELTEPDSPS
jgi:hypothetical protein